MGQLLTQIALADLPAPGQDVTAIDALSRNGFPARYSKANGYTCIEFGFRSDLTGSGDYALYRFWPDDKDWKPEGPRGATPTTINMATVAGQVPVRVSTLQVAGEFCVVLCAGTGIDDDEPVVLEGQIR